VSKTYKNISYVHDKIHIDIKTIKQVDIFLGIFIDEGLAWSHHNIIASVASKIAK